MSQVTGGRLWWGARRIAWQGRRASRPVLRRGATVGARTDVLHDRGVGVERGAVEAIEDGQLLGRHDGAQLGGLLHHLDQLGHCLGGGWGLGVWGRVGVDTGSVCGRRVGEGRQACMPRSACALTVVELARERDDGAVGAGSHGRDAQGGGGDWGAGWGG
jgi:hypothetical protein